MIRSATLRSLTVLQPNFITARYKTTNSIDIEEIESENALELNVVDQEAKLREEYIEKRRNKSGLRDDHRNMLFDTVPYTEGKHWTHGTLAYQRKMYARYGKTSEIDPALCWPTKQELFQKMEYEKVVYPSTIPEMMEAATKKREAKEIDIQQRQQQISQKLLKLDDWTRELRLKIAAKEAEATAAKERKEKLIEEVRRHFGFTVDSRDERFKEMLEKKEKEQKKAMKEARKKAKEEKILKVMPKNTEPSAVPEDQVKNN